MNFFENSFDFPLEPCYHGDIIDCCLEQDLMDVNTEQLPDNQERAG